MRCAICRRNFSISELGLEIKTLENLRHQYSSFVSAKDKVLYACIGLQCLAIYRFFSFGGINLSADRLLSVAAVFIAGSQIGSILHNRKRNDVWLFAVFCVILIFALTLSLLATTAGVDFVVSRYLSYLQAISFVFVSFVLVSYKPSGIILFKKAMVFTLSIIVLCSVYSLYIIFVKGQQIYTLPFLSLEDLYANEYYTGLFKSETRLLYPYCIPQELSMVTGFLALYGVKSYMTANTRKMLWLVFSLTACGVNILTFSRSGIFPMIICISMFMVISGSLKRIRGLWLIILVVSSVTLLLVGLVAMFGDKLGVIIPSVSRLINTDTESVLFQGHLDVRVMALHHWWHDLSHIEKLIGIGPGHYEIRFHLSSPHMTFLSYLLEIGLLGLSAFTILLLLAFRIIYYSNCDPTKRVYCFSILAYLILTALFYNYLRVSFWYIIMGYLIAISATKRIKY